MHHERLTKPRVVRRLLNYNSGNEDDRRNGRGRSQPWPTTSDSDTSDSNNKSSPIPIPGHATKHRGYCSDSSPCKNLPPIGVFWDIENCQIPRGRSAVAVAQAIRDRFFDGYREAEFLVVCDIKKESSQVMDELNDAQVNLNHVGSQCKNAADEKLRQCIRRFADLHGSLAAIVLISGDINFAPDLCDLRHRKKIYVILVHNDVCSESLMYCANEHHRFSELVENLPLRGSIKSVQPAEVTVGALPVGLEPGKVRQRLKRLAENCGGRVGTVMGELATVRFTSLECAMRAQKRMDGADVFGTQITVSQPIILKDFSPVKGHQRRYNGRQEEDMSWNSFVSSPSKPNSRYCNGNSQPPPVPLFNQENIPTYFPRMTSSGQPRQNFAHHRHSQSNYGRPILGRRNEPNHQNPRYSFPNNQSGRLSLDSMLDGDEGDLDSKPRRPPSLENWTQNGHPRSDLMGVNTSIPPPPIVNLPRKESQYLFHPIPMKSVDGSVLLVTNLDQRIDPLELKRCLNAFVSQFCLVLNVSVFIQQDGVFAAYVKVLPQNVSLVMQKLQGARIGNTNVSVSDNVNGHSQQHSPSPASSTSDSGELWFCPLHSRQTTVLKSLPSVTVRFNEFSSRLQNMLASHDNRLLLGSLVDCHEAMYGLLTMDELSVPLEYLVTCVPGIELVNTGGKKYLQPSTTHNLTPSSSKLSAEAESHLREKLTELLTKQPHCQILLNRFIPTYKTYFGTQITFSDYGCRRLIDVLGAIPQVVQVLGNGNSRVVTLSHQCQMQRFNADLLHLLSTKPDRQVALPDLSMYWQRIFGRSLEATDYGLCYVDDLLSMVSGEEVTVKEQATGRVISVKRKDQTQQQDMRKDQTQLQEKREDLTQLQKRLKMFAQQVVQVLSKETECSIDLGKFKNAYFNHFNIPCKQSDFGFEKLIDLAKAIPDVVEVGEGRMTLTVPERMKVLSKQLEQLVAAHLPAGLALDTVGSNYLWTFGYALKPASYQCANLTQLLNKLRHFQVIVTEEGTKWLLPADQTLRLRTLRILWEKGSGNVSVREFQQTYFRYFQEPCNMDLLRSELEDVVEVNGDKIRLSKLELLARDFYRLLCASEGRLPLVQLDASFKRVLDTTLSPEQYGYASTQELLQDLTHVVSLAGKDPKRVLVLNSQLAEAGIFLPTQMAKNTNHNEELPSKSDLSTSPAQVLLNGLKPKKNGEVTVSSVPLDFFKKNPNSSKNKTSTDTSNGVKSSPATNAKVDEAVKQVSKLTLLSPEMFLKPKTNCDLSFTPVSPDPSSLPKPGSFNLIQSFPDQGQSDYEQVNTESLDDNKRKLRLAAHFGLQLN